MTHAFLHIRKRGESFSACFPNSSDKAGTTTLLPAKHTVHHPLATASTPGITLPSPFHSLSSKMGGETHTKTSMASSYPQFASRPVGKQVCASWY